MCSTTQFRLLGYRSACLLTAFNATQLYILFVEIVHALAKRQSGWYGLVISNPLLDDVDK
jgi:hypothetical protein